MIVILLRTVLMVSIVSSSGHQAKEYKSGGPKVVTFLRFTAITLRLHGAAVIVHHQ